MSSAGPWSSTSSTRRMFSSIDRYAAAPELVSLTVPAKWVLTRPVRPTQTPYVGAYGHKDKRGPMNCSIYDHGDFCLYCVTSSEWDKRAPHVSSGPQPKKK